MKDVPLKDMTGDIGKWCINRQIYKAWVDASSLMTEVSLETNRNITMAACWLWPIIDTNISIWQLDTILKTINLALQWSTIELHLFMDFACVHWWVSITLTRKASLHTRVGSKMLIWRWLCTLEKLVQKYKLSLTVTLMMSDQNHADKLMRVL